MPNTSTVVDRFDDGTVDTGLWSDSYGTITEIDGRVRLTCDTGYTGLQTGPLYTFDSYSARLFPPAANTATECYIDIVMNSAAQPAGTDVLVHCNMVTGNIEFQSRSAYFDPSPTVITYNAGTHAWARFLRSGANLLYQTAPDGVTWTTRRTLAMPAWLDAAADVRISIETHRDAGTTNFAEADNVNSLPVAGNAAATSAANSATVAAGANAGAATATSSALTAAVASTSNAGAATYASAANSATVAAGANAGAATGSSTANNATGSIVGGTQYLFTTETPSLTDVNEAAPLTVATTFYVTAGGQVTGGRYFAPLTPGAGTFTLKLWSVDSGDPGTGTLLASKAFGTLTPGAWNNLDFDSPVTVTANTAYRIGVGMSIGRYTATNAFFTSALVNSQIVGVANGSSDTGLFVRNGTFTGSETGYPVDVFQSSCYFVDVAFTNAAGTNASAATATGSSTAHDAAAAVAIDAGAATGSSAALPAVASIGGNAGAATGSSTANAASTAAGANAGNAAATSSAQSATAAVTTNAGAATYASAAHDATVSTASQTSANADVAAATASATTASIALETGVAVASASTLSFDASAALAVNAAASAATFDALTASVTATVPAGFAAAVGTALDATGSSMSNAAAAAGSSTAFDAAVATSAEGTGAAGTALAGAAAFDATVQGAGLAPAGNAAALVDAFDALVALAAGSFAASAGAAAFDATVVTLSGATSAPPAGRITTETRPRVITTESRSVRLST